MSKIVQCVPNFSEGRREDVIQALAEALQVSGVQLLSTDSGDATNRTIFTIVGPPDSVVEGAMAAAKVAFDKIDLQQHEGDHPRIGALDVCPFIPVRNVSVDECCQLAEQFGQRLADELNVPVYLYGVSQNDEGRKTMAQIRQGG